MYAGEEMSFGSTMAGEADQPWWKGEEGGKSLGSLIISAV